ncbi:MAG: helix-turn-helix domain-containing protein [Deltaproteobacteria bacterium]|nr:helix-turn-helix domain-containing protein [Deltaproteobacteria bacterium]
MTLPMNTIQKLVGDITDAPFEYVDFAVTDDVGLFVPVSGQCYYAVTPSHTHPAFSFIVSFDDFCQVEVDEKIMRSTPGTFSAFSPDVPHQELPLDIPTRYVAIMVSSSYFNLQLKTYNKKISEQRGNVYESTERIHAALREFMAEYEEKSPGYEVLLQATGQKIVHLIIRQILAVEKMDEKVDFRMAANLAVEFMHKHLEDKITVVELARISRMSSSQFAKVFKEELGTAPIEYLQELRLIRSRRYLRDTNKNATEIALQCGFNSSSYFSRCYQNRFGVSPTEYRKKISMRE